MGAAGLGAAGLGVAGLDVAGLGVAGLDRGGVEVFEGLRRCFWGGGDGDVCEWHLIFYNFT